MEALAARDILSALACLPEAQREVLLPVGLEQFGYAEAAEVLNIPVGTEMSRLSRARELEFPGFSGDLCLGALSWPRTHLG
jgi:RNA polymerase sigma-70 factor (ECF subfamily)